MGRWDINRPKVIWKKYECIRRAAGGRGRGRALEGMGVGGGV